MNSSKGQATEIFLFFFSSFLDVQTHIKVLLFLGKGGDPVLHLRADSHCPGLLAAPPPFG